MLAKTERLTKKAFEQHFKAGKRFHFPHATIVFSPHPTFHGSVVVSKKTVKSAVKRNTLRRRIYAQLQHQCKTAQPTGVFIVLLKPTYPTLPRKAAATEMTNYIAAVQKKT